MLEIVLLPLTWMPPLTAIDAPHPIQSYHVLSAHWLLFYLWPPGKDHDAPLSLAQAA